MQCRICYEGENDQNLIQPCCCKGSVSYVHVSCFLKWMETKEEKKCEICGKIFVEKKEHGLAKPEVPVPYLDVDRIVADAVQACVLVTCVVWSMVKVIFKIN
jgi:E3 ubiquitin-protein ligase DOA10